MVYGLLLSLRFFWFVVVCYECCCLLLGVGLVCSLLSLHVVVLLVDVF